MTADIQRWTGTVIAHEHGGFVAYGDYLELKAERDALLRTIFLVRPFLPDRDSLPNSPTSIGAAVKAIDTAIDAVRGKR